MPNLRRWVLTTEMFPTTVVPFVVVVPIKYLTNSATPTDRTDLNLKYLPRAYSDVIAAMLFCCHRFKGRVFVMFNEPYIYEPEGEKSVLDAHHRAAICNSLTFIFVMEKSVMMEGLVGEQDDANASPAWLSNEDVVDDLLEPMVAEDLFEETASTVSRSAWSYDQGTSTASTVAPPVPVLLQQNLSYAVLDLLATRLQLASFAFIQQKPMKPSVRAKIDFIRATPLPDMIPSMMKTTGGTYFHSSTFNRAPGPNSVAMTCKFESGTLTEFLDAAETVLGSVFVKTQNGDISVQLDGRGNADACTLVWLKMKRFMGRNVFENRAVVTYVSDALDRYLQSAGLPLNSGTESLEHRLSDHRVRQAFSQGPVRILKELTKGYLTKLTMPEEVDAIIFAYEPHELMRGDGKIDTIPRINFESMEARAALKRFEVDESSEPLKTIEVYAALMTEPEVVNADPQTDHNKYFSLMWPHLHTIRTVLSRQYSEPAAMMRDRHKLGHQIDSAWCVGLELSSPTCRRFYHVYRKRLGETGKPRAVSNGGDGDQMLMDSISTVPNYAKAMHTPHAYKLGKWRTAWPAVTMMAGLSAKLFSAHVLSDRLLQSEVTFKMVIDSTGPRWRDSRTMLINFTPTAHGKTRATNLVNMLLSSFGDLIVRKASITPNSLKYAAESEGCIVGATVSFDDTTISAIDLKSASDETSSISAMLKNILDTCMAVSTIASSITTGTLKAKTVCTVHNVQWNWNVNAIGLFSTAVLDRSLILYQEDRASDRETADTLMAGNRADELVVTRYGLNKIAEVQAVRLHVHKSLLGTMAPHLLAPCVKELNFLYTYLCKTLRRSFYLTDTGDDRKTRTFDKTMDLTAVTAQMMALNHVFDSWVPPYVPIRAPYRNEPLKDYLTDLRERTWRANECRTREDFLTDVVCCTVLYSPPALVSSVSASLVQPQSMHLCVLQMLVDGMAAGYYQPRGGTTLTIPKTVFGAYYQFNESNQQLLDLRRCAFTVNAKKVSIVDTITITRPTAEGPEQTTGRAAGPETCCITFNVHGLYSLSMTLLDAEYAKFVNWYEREVAALLDSDCKTRDCDVGAEPLIYVLWLELRQKLGYKLKVLRDAHDVVVVFDRTCPFIYADQIRRMVTKRLKKGIVDGYVKNSIRTECADEEVVDEGMGELYTQVLPFNPFEVNSESNYLKEGVKLKVHWKCLETGIPIVWPDVVTIEGNYVVLDAAANQPCERWLRKEGKKTVLKNRYKTSSGYQMWTSINTPEGKAVKAAIFLPFVELTPQPIKFFGRETLYESGWSNLSSVKAFEWTFRGKKVIEDYGHEPGVPTHYSMEIKNPGTVIEPTFTLHTDPNAHGKGDKSLTLNEGWEYTVMAKIWKECCGRSMTDGELQEWYQGSYLPVSLPFPTNYSRMCQDVKSGWPVVKADTTYTPGHFLFARAKRFFGEETAAKHLGLTIDQVDWDAVHALVKESCMSDEMLAREGCGLKRSSPEEPERPKKKIKFEFKRVNHTAPVFTAGSDTDLYSAQKKKQQQRKKRTKNPVVIDDAESTTTREALSPMSTVFSPVSDRCVEPENANTAWANPTANWLSNVESFFDEN
ncbi:protein Allo56 [Anguillid herpesvirus 1]|uniref:Protein Allo56 n=1 Tax=Anguillid herpesvirus 1 TaxID=150286 RepID=A0A8E5AQR2_9VIRU|nr:protein Allo56 [Anguillid herpesvirus 1]QRM16785.1 protein Allo56 [Anguillid herpesvirus 1]QRM17177.1 protein Allo56 [Anguillid herpesvirus 1]UWI83670.1 protein Allo56 [Anguillid herpesvirus 1]